MNEPELMAIDWNCGDRIYGTANSVKQMVEFWSDRYTGNDKAQSKVKVRSFNKTLWELWKSSWNDGEVLNLISCLQEDRKIEIGCNDEYQSITEFLWLHDTGFIVSNIDSRYSICTITIANE